jgi:RNA polymerase sigma-70 factor (ECF subfamily)
MSDNDLEFQRVYEAFQPKIHRYLTRLVGENEAEDLTQEVFAKVSQSLADFRGESQLSTWLYRIATNAGIDRMRALSFRQDARTSSLDDSIEAEAIDVWTGEKIPSLERILMRNEMYECFLGFLSDLPPDYRIVFVLSELAEMKNKEIAEILGLSLDTVKIRLHRGRNRLLQELKAHCKAEDWL